MDSHPLFAYTTLAASAASGATSITLTDATDFPDPASGAYNIAVWPVSTKPTKANAEVMRATAKTGAALTVTRAQEGSTAYAFAAGDEVAVAITPKTLTDIETAISDHLADTADAHDASAISVDSTTLVGTGTDAQAVFEELDNAIADHLADATDAHDASAISVLDTATQFTGTDVEAVLAEIQDNLDAHLADTGDAHDASAISILDTAGDFTATDVEGALAELQSDNEGHVAAADPHPGYVLESLIDAIGDLIVGSAADTVTRLAKGSTGQVLSVSADGSLYWKAESGGSTVYDRSTAPTEVVSTTAETTVYTKTVTGGDMSTDKMLRLTLIGDYLFNRNTTDTLTLRIKFGGTTYISVVNASASIANARQPWRMTVEVANLGANNSQMIVAALTTIAPDGAVAGTGIGWWAFLEGAVAARNYPVGGIGGISTLAAQDTSTDKAIAVTAQFNVSSASNSWRARYALLELL